MKSKTPPREPGVAWGEWRSSRKRRGDPTGGRDGYRGALAGLGSRALETPMPGFGEEHGPRPSFPLGGMPNSGGHHYFFARDETNNTRTYNADLSEGEVVPSSVGFSIFIFLVFLIYFFVNFSSFFRFFRIFPHNFSTF